MECVEYEKEWIGDVDADLSKEHLRKKENRAVKMGQQERHRKRLREGLLCSGSYKPSIWVDGDWNEDFSEYVYSDKIMRGKNSRLQQGLKRIAEHVVRNLPLEALPRKGNAYKKAFDYYWEWV